MSDEIKTLNAEMPSGFGSTTPGFIGIVVGLILIAAGAHFALSNLTDTGTLIIAVPLALIGLIVTLFFLSGFMNVKEHQMGALIRRLFGKKMLQGQIVARSFSDIGIQTKTLVAGLYWFNPLLWMHKVINETIVDNEQIGEVTAIDGVSLSPGRLLGDKVDCKDFQDASAFLENGGAKGPQIGYLLPGQYRINTEVFKVKFTAAKTIREGHLGLVVAKDGQSLPSGYIVAPEPKLKEGVTCQQLFQVPQEFIASGGYRGPQLPTLQPGKYYINTLIFDVTEIEQSKVPPGYVAVIISYVGKELADQPALPSDVEETATFKQAIHEKAEVVLQTDAKERGILAKPVATGTYNLNIMAYKPILVATSAITIDWADVTPSRETDVIGVSSKEKVLSSKAEDFFKFSRLKIASKDAFLLNVAVRLIIRIRAEHAPFVIARFGSIANLIEQIAHPLIDSSFRNKAGDEEALAFYKARAALQEDAWKKAKEAFENFHIEVPNLLLSYIDIENKALLDTQTLKQIATQEIEQYAEQAKAQTAKADLEEQKSRAEKQKALIDAELGIIIAENNAKAAVKTAEGERDARKAEGEGEATYLEKTGTAKGAEPKAIGLANADAYKEQVKALGANQTMAIAVAKALAEGKVKIVPEILVVGGGSGNTSEGLQTIIMGLLAKSGGLGSLFETPKDTIKTEEKVAKDKTSETASDTNSTMKTSETPKPEVKPETPKVDMPKPESVKKEDAGNAPQSRRPW